MLYRFSSPSTHCIGTEFLVNGHNSAVQATTTEALLFLTLLTIASQPLYPALSVLLPPAILLREPDSMVSTISRTFNCETLISATDWQRTLNAATVSTEESEESGAAPCDSGFTVRFGAGAGGGGGARGADGASGRDTTPELSESARFRNEEKKPAFF